MKKTILFLWIFLVITQPCLTQNDALTNAEQMPYFAGCTDIESQTSEKRVCSDQHLIQFIAQHLKYPEDAKAQNIEGTVYINFIINELGEVVHPHVMMDIGAGCGEAALKVVQAMPHWEPAIHHGEKVKVKLNLPIQFSLKGEDDYLSDSYSIIWGSLKGQKVTQGQLKENLTSEVTVRDELGDSHIVDELTFILEKNNRKVQIKSNGKVSSAMKRMLDKAKKGGTFTIVTSIQDKGQFVSIERSFLVH